MNLVKISMYVFITVVNGRQYGEILKSALDIYLARVRIYVSVDVCNRKAR